MFALPSAKRVRRSELEASSSPPPSEPDAELQAQFRARLARIYGNATLVSAPEGGTQAVQEGVVGEGEALHKVVEEEQIFEFRLFESTSKAEGQEVEAQKIVLQNANNHTGTGGFAKTRDPRVFIVGRAEGERKRRLESVAVSGEDVLDAAGKRAWGLEVPWRVKVITVVGKRKLDKGGHVVIHVEANTGETKRKRPGKKRRIFLRERKKAKHMLAEKRRVELASKEEAEREKRTRRNREKKVKRRMKEKAMKAAGNAGSSNPIDASAESSPELPANVDV